MSAVLRISGANFDLDGALACIPAHLVDQAWRVGDIKYLRKVSKTSGLSIILARTEDSSRLVADAMETFLELAPRVLDFVRRGASWEIDFAIFVGASGSQAIAFDADVLSTLEPYGVRISVSAYPVSDDDRPDDS